MSKYMQKQRGVALIVGIIFLLILSLFVLGAMRDVLLQEKMAGAYRNMSQAQTTTDSILRNAESAIYTTYVLNGDPPEYSPIDNELGTATALRDFRSGAGYMTTGATVPSLGPVPPTRGIYSDPTTDSNSTLAQAGGYFIEGAIPITDENGEPLEFAATQTGEVAGKAFVFRITARATGGSDSFVRAAESVYLVTR